MKVLIDSLIYPNRLDILLRTHFLTQYDSGLRDFKFILYYQFRVRIAPVSKQDADAAIKNFILLYKAIKKEGINSKIDVVSLDNEYGLFDGAHRVAILKHLGNTEIDCNIVSRPTFKIPNYTKRISQEYNQFTNEVENLVTELQEIGDSLSGYSQRLCK